MFQIIFGGRQTADTASREGTERKAGRKVERVEIEALLQDELTGLPPLAA